MVYNLTSCNRKHIVIFGLQIFLCFWTPKGRNLIYGGIIARLTLSVMPTRKSQYVANKAYKGNSRVRALIGQQQAICNLTITKITVWKGKK
jgi:hypothetical protein